MLMVKNGVQVSRDTLALIPTPPSTDTWTPLAHSEVVTALLDHATSRGLRIHTEKYATMPGHLRQPDGSIIEVPGGRLFATFDFHPIDGVEFPNGCLPSMGLRNSHDKHFALSVLSGARVLICSNGVLSAEHVSTRKHTSRIDMQQSIGDALSAFMDSTRMFNDRQKRLVQWGLNDNTAKALTVDMAKAGAFSPSDILKVYDAYDHPEHSDFVGRNAWSLYNAATGRMKSQSPARQVEGFKALGEVLWDVAPALDGLLAERN